MPTSIEERIARVDRIASQFTLPQAALLGAVVANPNGVNSYAIHQLCGIWVKTIHLDTKLKELLKSEGLEIHCLWVSESFGWLWRIRDIEEKKEPRE